MGWFRWTAAVVAAVVLVACNPSETTVRIWHTTDGDPVPADLIRMRRGDDHCGWHDVWFLETGNPGDTVLRPVTQSPQQFVADRYGLLTSEALRTAYSPNAALPDDATPTGYVSEGSELWVSPSEMERAVFLVGESGVERLPSALPPIYCD